MGNYTSINLNADKIRKDLALIYETLHPSFSKTQIDNFKLTLSPSDTTVIKNIFEKTIESLELSIYGKISIANLTLNARSEKMLELIWMQNEMGNIYLKIMGQNLINNPFICDNSENIVVHHPLHGFSNNTTNYIIFQNSKQINYKNINDKLYPIKITNENFYSIKVESLITFSKGEYGGDSVKCCLQSQVDLYKKSLLSMAKIEKSLCNFEKQVFGFLNLCYPDLKGRIMVLKKKIF